jgi:hypothetical protein
MLGGMLKYTHPSGITSYIRAEQEDFLNRKSKRESIPYPWKGLNDKLYGMRRGELVTLNRWYRA